jgi:N-acetylglucosamine kinase-like BadF-type ATPase
VRAGRTGPGGGALRSGVFRDERRSRGQARDTSRHAAGGPPGGDQRRGDRAVRATRTGQGIITIAGTGSIAYGRNPAGRSARAGGWGHIFGDEGGGFDIARQAARAVLRLEEGWGPATALREMLLEATVSENANEMLHRFYTDEWPRSRVATLARLVDAAAAESDGVALGILQGAAQQLAILAGAVRAELWSPGTAVEVAYIGGVFQSRILLESFRTLVELQEGVRCGAPRRGPAEGALREAYRSVGMEWGGECGG